MSEDLTHQISIDGVDAEVRKPKRRRLNDNPSHQEPPLQRTAAKDLLGQAHLEQRECFEEACAVQRQEHIENCGENGNSDIAEAEGRPLENTALISGECCYGMVSKKKPTVSPPLCTLNTFEQLSNIPVRLIDCLDAPNRFLVVFESPDILRAQDSSANQILHVENSEDAYILTQLKNINEVKTQSYCHARTMINPLNKLRRNGRGDGVLRRTWVLNTILYGLPDLEMIIGKFLARHNMHLQDPLHCGRNVPYRNPHMISPEDGKTIMTGSLEQELGNLHVEALESGPDLLSKLMKDEVPLAESEAPHTVKTRLFRFVTFFALDLT